MNRRLFLASVAVAVAMFSGCHYDKPRVVTPLSRPAKVRVGSYNIRLATGDKGTPNAWPERRDDLVALIRKLDLDVFGLQEVRPEQAAFFAERLPEYVYVGEHRGADRKSDEASPVCYRKDRFNALKSGTFWLSETPEVPGKKGWGAACPRVCSWLLLEDKATGRRFCFANTHTDHVSELARKEGMLLVISRMKEFGAGVPIVFTGDHNCRETEEPAEAISKLLKNALYESETSPKGPWRTFNGWKWRDGEYSTVDALKISKDVRNARKGSPDAEKSKDGAHPWEDCGARIDYIYVSPGVRVLDYATHADPRPGTQLYPSDHFPLTATIVIPAH